MRLIDADKLENDIVENITVKAVSRMLAITQGQPTVKAVPIERINNWLIGLVLSELIANTTTVKAIPIEWIWNWINTKGVFAQYISDMIEDWEKENEK